MNRSIRWEPGTHPSIPNGQYSTLAEGRAGVMLHFDDSGTDAGAMGWFRDPTCKVSYNRLVLDDGRYVQIAPDDRAAWHAGHCSPSDPRLKYRQANHGLYGLAVATNTSVQVTALQLLTVAWCCRQYFARHGWDPVADAWRVVGHDSEAVFGPKHAKAGQRGRKIDPTGNDRKRPILDVRDVRALLPLIEL